jgi:hypothetical protein
MPRVPPSPHPTAGVVPGTPVTPQMAFSTPSVYHTGGLGGAAICEAAAAADDVHDALEEELTVGNRGWGWAAQVPEGLQGGAATAAAQALRLAMSMVVRKDPIETPIDTLLTPC